MILNMGARFMKKHDLIRLLSRKELSIIDIKMS